MLMEGYTLFKGYSQGNSAQPSTLVLPFSALLFLCRIHVPCGPSPTTMPINQVCYNDDRAMVNLVSNLASTYVQACLEGWWGGRGHCLGP